MCTYLCLKQTHVILANHHIRILEFPPKFEFELNMHFHLPGFLLCCHHLDLNPGSPSS